MAFRQRDLREITLDDLMRDPGLGSESNATPRSARELQKLEEEVDIRRHELAYATTTVGITKRDGGTLKVEESVYGAALVMPQLARTVGWNTTFTTFAIRSVLFLVLNIFVQAFLLKKVMQEQLVMDAFAGRMHLCDFGIDTCPGPGCRGPAGTDITPSRLYDHHDIVSRTFMKDSLKAIFPDRIEDINAKLDVGEYGMESNMCRYICCFIFMINCLDELEKIWGLGHLLYHVPSEDEPWIRPLDDYEDLRQGRIEDVTIRIAGIPRIWKVINVMLIFIPKFMLWKLTVSTGFTFLMETAAIDDLIINSCALGLILQFDELVMASLMHEEERDFVSAVEEYEFYDSTTSCVGDMSLLTDEEIVNRYKQEQFGIRSWGLDALSLLFPYKLVLSLAGTCFFVTEYYRYYCTPDEKPGAHRYVSKPMYTPSSAAFSWCTTFFPDLFPMKEEGEPYWEMPSTSE